MGPLRVGRYPRGLAPIVFPANMCIMCAALKEVRDLAKTVADCAQPRRILRSTSLEAVFAAITVLIVTSIYIASLPSNPARESVLWWTNQNCVEDFYSLRKELPGPVKWLEQHAPLCSEIEQGKVVHRDRNVVCVRLPAKPA